MIIQPGHPSERESYSSHPRPLTSSPVSSPRRTIAWFEIQLVAFLTVSLGSSTAILQKNVGGCQKEGYRGGGGGRGLWMDAFQELGTRCDAEGRKAVNAEGWLPGVSSREGSDSLEI